MNLKYKCVVIDDDIVDLKIVSSLVKKTQILDLIGAYQEPQEGVSTLISNEVDIVFLDIQMPGLSGMDIIKNLNSQPEVIIISSDEDYALETYDYGITDYLIKPVENYARFLKAVERAIGRIRTKKSGRDLDSLFVKDGTKLINLNVKSIDYLEAFGDFIKIHTSDHVYTTHGRMKNAEENLPSGEFARIHRSYIVRIDKIANIEVNSLQIGQKILPISGSYKDSLFEKLKML